MGYSKSDCVEALQTAAELVGEPVTVLDYRGLDLSPSPKTISAKFGSWPAANREAGLLYVEHGKNKAFLSKQSGKPIREDNFEQIDTVEKAYWLGFIYGDGSVCKQNESRLRFYLEIQADDIEHLRKFRNAVESEHKISRRERDYDGHLRETASIAISNQVFVNHLRERGITRTKTFDARLPALENHLRPAFTRGVSDADGHVGLDNGRSPRWSLASSSRERLRDIREWLPGKSEIYSHQSKNTCDLNSRLSEEVKQILNWMYPDQKDTAPALARKRKVAENICHW